MKAKKYIASFLAVFLFLSNQVRAAGNDKEEVVKNIESVVTTEAKNEKASVGESGKNNHTVLLSVGGAVVALCGGIVGGYFVSGYLADKANKKQGDDIKESLEKGFESRLKKELDEQKIQLEQKFKEQSKTEEQVRAEILHNFETSLKQFVIENKEICEMSFEELKKKEQELDREINELNDRININGEDLDELPDDDFNLRDSLFTERSNIEAMLSFRGCEKNKEAVFQGFNFISNHLKKNPKAGIYLDLSKVIIETIGKVDKR